MHSIELKLGIYVINHNCLNLIDFGKRWMHIFFFFSGVQDIILMHYVLWSQVIISVQISKQLILLSLNLDCVLKVTVLNNVY